MNCLSCQHLLVSDWEDRRGFFCGHSDFVELDNIRSAPEIVDVPWNAVDELCVLTHGPAWCPRELPQEVSK